MSKYLPSFKYSLCAFVLALVFQSCEIINPPEQIPFYLRIDSISFLDSATTPPSYAIKGAQKISDAWVYVDDELVGVFELPATVPVLKESGSHRIKIFPGIMANGMNHDRRPYPFFSSYAITLNTNEGTTDTLTPVVSYNPTIFGYPPEGAGHFPEGFEGAGIILKTAGSSTIDTAIRTSDPNLVFEGNYSLLFELDATKDYVEFETTESYSLKSDASPTYIEMNYRADMELSFGLYAEDIIYGTITPIPFINLFPTDGEWKKVYISVAADLTQYKTHKFKLYFKAYHNSGLAVSKLLIDNLKLVRVKP